MKIFLSWSGEQSREVAEAFSDWIQCVIQECRPWISTRDIERGSVWFAEISEQLRDVSIGIIFLTKENLNKPWILFEAGALAKGLTNNRVCTFLIDLMPADISDPLAQFNHTLPSKIYVLGLVKTLNSASERPLEEKILDRIFDTYWLQLEKQIKLIQEKYKRDEEENVKENDKEYLGEILDAVKNLSNRIARMENRNNVTELPERLRLIESSNPKFQTKAQIDKFYENTFKKLLDTGINRTTLEEKLRIDLVPEILIKYMFEQYDREKNHS